jgi:hypothetical protein
MALVRSRCPSYPPQVVPICRSGDGSIMAITPWLHYADPTLAPLCRSLRGSNVPISDSASTGFSDRQALNYARPFGKVASAPYVVDRLSVNDSYFASVAGSTPYGRPLAAKQPGFYGENGTPSPKPRTSKSATALG